MFKELLFIAKSGHAYWRSVSFSEIAELYASRFLRVVAQNLVDAFVIVYLYQQGYSLTSLCLILGFYFLYKTLWGYLSAHIVAWFGPKTSLLISNVVAIPALISLAYRYTYQHGYSGVFFVRGNISSDT